MPVNAVVTLTVAAPVTVPDVTGLTQLTARTQLSNGGFKVNVKNVDTTDKSENFVVQSQTPEGGTKVGKGATVTITVAMYSPPPKTTTTTTTTPTTTTTTTSAPTTVPPPPTTPTPPAP